MSVSIFRPQLLPSESVESYMADFCHVNLQPSISEGLEFAADLLNICISWKTVTNWLEVVAALSGVHPHRLYSKHTIQPFRIAAGDIPKRGGIGMSDFRVSPIRLCEECAKDDLRHHGRIRGLREHQLPGNYWCTEHAMQALINVDSVDFIRTIADRRKRVCAPSIKACSDNQWQYLKTYIYISRALLSRRVSDKEKMSAVFHERADELSIPLGGGNHRTRLVSDLILRAAPLGWLRTMSEACARKPIGKAIALDYRVTVPSHWFALKMAALFTRKECEQLIEGELFEDHPELVDNISVRNSFFSALMGLRSIRNFNCFFRISSCVKHQIRIFTWSQGPRPPLHRRS